MHTGAQLRSIQSLYLPQQMSLSGKVCGNVVKQLRRPALSPEAEVGPYKNGRVVGHIVAQQNGTRTLITSRITPCPGDVDEVLLTPDGTVLTDEKSYSALRGRPRWLSPIPVEPLALSRSSRESWVAEVRQTWSGQFHFREEQRLGGTLIQHGLRGPQIGAVYSTLGFWKASNEVATIVMPTGTGKTETMLALLVKERIRSLLVVVPTSTLREQTAEKFLTLGVLKDTQVVGDDALYPVVGTLKHRLNDIAEVEELFGCCNVVVATMQVISQCEEAVQSAIAQAASHLFIDEAHHVSARTWDKFRQAFAGETILQFTATPFRSDRKPVSGNVIFNYSLRQITLRWACPHTS